MEFNSSFMQKVKFLRRCSLEDLFTLLDLLLGAPAVPVFVSNFRAVGPEQSTGFHMDSAP